MIVEQSAVVETAETLFAAGKNELAFQYLTEYSSQKGAAGLQLGRALLGSIEARTAILFGLRKPQEDVMSGLNLGRVDCQP